MHHFQKILQTKLIMHASLGKRKTSKKGNQHMRDELTDNISILLLQERNQDFAKGGT